MPAPPTTDPPPLADSPLYLLAVLYSARRSRDRALERVTRRRLDQLGIHITFGDELSPSDAPQAQGVTHVS